MPQDRDLLSRAKAMRHEATPFEVILWRHLSGSRLGGFKFRRQHVIGPMIVGFFCPAKKLIVEVDGDTHDAARDARRDGALTIDGYRVLRFGDAEVRDNLEAVLEAILLALNERPARWATSPPCPNPSPEGEGLE